MQEQFGEDFESTEQPSSVSGGAEEYEEGADAHVPAAGSVAYATAASSLSSSFASKVALKHGGSRVERRAAGDEYEEVSPRRHLQHPNAGPDCGDNDGDCHDKELLVV